MSPTNKVITVVLLVIAGLFSCKKNESAPQKKVNISMMHLLKVSPTAEGTYWRKDNRIYSLGFQLSNDSNFAVSGSVKDIRAIDTLPLPLHFACYNDIDLSKEGDSRVYSVFVYAFATSVPAGDTGKRDFLIDTMQFRFSDPVFQQKPASVLFNKRGTLIELSFYWY